MQQNVLQSIQRSAVKNQTRGVLVNVGLEKKRQEPFDWTAATFKRSLIGVTHTKGLTAVDSLEASVISRLPLRPSSAGTRMNTSVTSLNTGQCCKGEQGRSEPHHSAVETLIGIKGLAAALIMPQCEAGALTPAKTPHTL